MLKKKKIIILSCMIALLAVTAVFNFVLTGINKGKDDNSPVSAANYFSQYRLERMTTRNEELLQLDAIISAADEGSQEKSDALTMKLELTEITEQELLLESLIKAQGFEDTVVTIGLSSDNINVIVKTDELTQVDAVKIYSIVSAEVDAAPENVKIIPIS